jgi:hypothetical protein
MKKTGTLFLAVLFSISALAQEMQENKKINLDLGTDVVSSYIWRGLSFNQALNFQPWLDVSLGNFNAGFWGSYNLTGDFLEPDMYFNYTFGLFNITLTDFHGNSGEDFFNFKKNETAHTGELMLQFHGNEKFPLAITASALIYGDDKKILSYNETAQEYILSSENNYSLYVELGYQFIAKNGISVDFFVGSALKESYFYDVKKANFINVGLKAQKEIKINDSFSLPLHFSFISNPENKNVFYVIGFSL